MNPEDQLLDRSAIEDAFRRLGDRLARRGVVADLYVFGGAAMALAYDARRTTRDIDAIFQPCPHAVTPNATTTKLPLSTFGDIERVTAEHFPHHVAQVDMRRG